MKYVGAIRRELGFRTVFNILGPLTNPIKPSRQLLGVYDEYLLEPLAKVLTSLGVKNGMVVYGREKLDELSTAGETAVCEFNNGEYSSYVLTPEQFGLTRSTKKDLEGGTPEENAAITCDILSGKDRGPKFETVLMNAGAALYIAGKATDIADGIEKARELIDNGEALKAMERFVDLSNK